MEAGFDPKRLSDWLAEVASTEEEEVDCNALAEMLETIIVIADKNADIRVLLPQVAVHLEHCPECREWYETLVALGPELE